MDKSSKRLKIQARSKKEPTFPITTVQYSPTENFDENVDSVAVNANTKNTEFVNHAFILWTEMRQQWVGNRPPKKAKQFAEPVLRYNTIYESLLRTKKPYSQRIPLPEMIKFLVNDWKKEEMYGEPEQAYTC